MRSKPYIDSLNSDDGPPCKVRMVCRYCGSDQVVADAYATWDVERQEWSISAVFDKGAYCSECDGETRIEEQVLP